MLHLIHFGGDVVNVVFFMTDTAIEQVTHGSQCGWHYDQYDQECNCGFKRPMTRLYVECSIGAAEASLERATKQVAYWKERLDGFED
jgi:hypothetical protein